MSISIKKAVYTKSLSQPKGEYIFENKKQVI